MEFNYTVSQVAPIALLPFFAFVINAFIVKRFTKLAVAISCIAIFLSFVISAFIFNDFFSSTFTQLIIIFIEFLIGLISIRL